MASLSWAQQLLSLPTAPQLSGASLAALTAVYERNQQADADLDQATAILRTLTAEAKAETSRIDNILDVAGLTASLLDGKCSKQLSSLSETAVALSVDVADVSVMMVAIARLQRDVDEVEEANKTLRREQASLTRCIRQTLVHENRTTETVSDLQAAANAMQTESIQRADERDFFRSKQSQYEHSIQQGLARLDNLNYSDELTHDTVVLMQQQLDQHAIHCNSLKAQLQVYADLPPNPNLARLKLEEARQQLHELERQVASRIDVVHS